MTGFLILRCWSRLALALLWLMKLRGPLLTLAAAALMLGCAGYALQGAPTWLERRRNGSDGRAIAARPVPAMR